MRHHIVLALVSAELLFASANVMAAGGTINISGRIVEDSCLVTLAGGAGGASSLTLPAVSQESLTRVGATAGATPMNMALSDCPAQASVRAWFEPVNVDRNTGNLANLATIRPAANVQVQITDGKNRRAIDLRDSHNNLYATVNEGGATLDYSAQYISVGGAATTGNVESHLIYTVEYH